MLAGQRVEKQMVETWIHGESPAMQTWCAQHWRDALLNSLALEVGVMKGANEALGAQEILYRNSFHL